MTKKHLEWYVLEKDSNTRELIRINVLNDYRVDEIMKRIKKEKAKTYEEIKEIIKRELMYYYWCKTEHEVLISGLFDDNLENAEKIDIWYQLEPNLDRIVEYFISNTHCLEE